MPTWKSIDQAVSFLHQKIWRARSSIGVDSSNPLNLLDPKISISLLDINLEEVGNLGFHQHNNGNFEIAGFLDRKKTKSVY